MIDFNKYFIVGTNSYALHDTMNGLVIGELIRCKDCKYWEESMRIDRTPVHRCAIDHFEWEAEDFCSRGERKEE